MNKELIANRLQAKLQKLRNEREQAEKDHKPWHVEEQLDFAIDVLVEIAREDESDLASGR